MLPNNTTTPGGPPHLSMSITAISTNQIVSCASQAMQAIAGRHTSMHPIPITTFPNTPSSMVSTAVQPNFFHQGMLATPNCVPSVTVSHTAQAQTPIVTVQHLPNNARGVVHHTHRNPTNIQSPVIQTARRQIVQDPSHNYGSKQILKGCTVNNNEAPGVNGEHVIHQVVQAISENQHDGPVPDTLTVAEDIEKNPKSMDVIDGLTVKMEVNGENVEEVDSIGETVTIETTESCDNSPVKDSRKESTRHEMGFSNNEAVVVRVNGSHGDERGS